MDYETYNNMYGSRKKDEITQRERHADDEHNLLTPNVAFLSGGGKDMPGKRDTLVVDRPAPPVPIPKKKYVEDERPRSETFDRYNSNNTPLSK